MDGFETARAIRALEASGRSAGPAHVPVIAMTADAARQDRNTGAALSQRD